MIAECRDEQDKYEKGNVNDSSSQINKINKDGLHGEIAASDCMPTLNACNWLEPLLYEAVTDRQSAPSPVGVETN